MDSKLAQTIHRISDLRLITVTKNNVVSSSINEEEPRRAPAPALLEEIVLYSILPRLPVRTVQRFKAAKRSWHQVTTDPRFIRAHLDHARKRNRSRIVVVPRGRDPGDHKVVSFYSYEMGRTEAALLHEEKFEEEDASPTELQHCDGLLFLAHGPHLILCNPAIREMVKLPCSPDPDYAPPRFHSDYNRSGFGYDPSAKVYKVARYFYRKYDLQNMKYDIGMEVFVLGSYSWRLTAEAPPYPICVQCLPESVGGAVYYMIDERFHPHPSSPKGILCFDLKDENFRHIPLPSSVKDHIHVKEGPNFSLLALGGNLCVGNNPRGTRLLEIWMYKSTERSTHEWIRSFSFTIQPPASNLKALAVHHQKLLLHMHDGQSDCLQCFDGRKSSFEKRLNLAEDLAYCDRREENPCFRKYHKHSFVNAVHYVESLMPVRPSSKRLGVSYTHWYWCSSRQKTSQKI